MDDYGLGNGPCERRVLRLVSMGNAIIAELLRLNDNLPVTLRLGKKDDKKFAPVLFDFSYFKHSESVEQKIKADKNLSRLDAELRDTHLELITRFYVVYEAIYKYVTDLNAVVRDLEDGVYFQHSLNTMFSTVDGRQLMCELVQLYGVALLTADRIGGSTRERLLVAYQRLGVRADSATCHVDDVCRLLRDTGVGTSAATGYPQLYFSRVEVDVRLVRLTLSHLRSADLYCQTADNYTLPEHRCVALSSQAAMLFVCQFFSPNTLHKETTAMREIVDRFFSDNWVINVYMGWCVNLFEWWEPFKAARQALHGCLDLVLVKQLTSNHADKLQELVTATGQQLRKGVMTADVVLHDWERLMSLVRECNITLRWCLLGRVQHSTDVVRRSRQLREVVLSEPRLDVASLFQLLLNAAQLENSCRIQLKQLLATREAVWTQKQAELVAGLSEVADVFSGAISLTRLAKNVGLERWFRERSVDMAAVTLHQASADSGKLLQMIRALSQVQTLHRMESDLAVVQRLEQLRALLRDLTLTAGLRDRQLACLDVLADFSYGWQLVDSLMPHMQLLIAQRPKVLAKFHAIFIKVSSALDTPLMRINQAGSGDLESVSQFYSAEMVRYVKQLLQVVPRTMFRLLERIVDILTSELKELPPRIEESKIGEYVQPEVRSKISSLVYELCVLTEGMLSMKTTLVGIVHLDPAELLRDGCGSQLSILLSDVLNSTLAFSQKQKSMDVLSRLEALDRRLQGLQRGLEYTQDYLRISGLKLWKQQLDQLLTSLVQQEAERVGRLSWTQQDWTREFGYGGASTGIKQGVAEPNCVGRLVEQLLMATHPRQTVYVNQQLSWCSRSPQQQPAAAADRQLVQLVLSCLGVTGLLGVDRLLGLRARAILKSTLSLITVDIGRDVNCSDTLDSLHATFKLSGTDTGLPRACSSAISLLHRHLYRLMEQMALLGQLSLLREVIALQIRIGARLNSPHLSAMLNTLCRSVMSETDAVNDTLTLLLRQLTPYLSHAGLTQPRDTVYLSQVQVREPVVQRYTPTLLALLIYAQTSKFTYCGKFGDLLPVKDGVDPSALVAGISCLLAQLPASSGGRVAALVSRLVCACVSMPGSPPSADIAVLLRLLERLRYERHLSDAGGACGVPAIVVSTFRCQ